MDPLRLFVYGTLLFDEIAAKVVGRVPRVAPATLHGYRRIRLRDRPYPAIRRARAAHVSGHLLSGLTGKQLRRIDAYEGREYRRQRVRVRLPGGARVTAWTYVAVNTTSGANDWSEQAFRRRHLHRWRSRI